MKQVGAWLCKDWNLPEELAIAMRWHHSERYQGEHALYAHLTLAVDRLLKRNGLGDTPGVKIPLAITESLGASEEQAVMVMQSVMARCEDLALVARQFSR